jgi:TDG/mug DNA glycosylase family protein
MPGKKSLENQQYYAHPRNQFWRLMGDLYGAGLLLSYDERIKILKTKGIAVWDVLRACTRAGSMDAHIKKEVANNFERFFAQHPKIALVVFDSATAEKLYKKHVLKTLTKELIYRLVPSPSPAHARLSYAEKLALWAKVLKEDGCGGSQRSLFDTMDS